MKEEGKIIYKELSYKIIGILFDVYNDLGYGYQEKYYEKAIAKYFEEIGIEFQRQVPYKISIKGEIIGRYYLDFLVENKVVLEIKKGDYFSKRNISQIKGYLKVTKMKLAIIACFTSKGVKFFRALNPSNILK
jgi:GxxExxY protein